MDGPLRSETGILNCFSYVKTVQVNFVVDTVLYSVLLLCLLQNLLKLSLLDLITIILGISIYHGSAINANNCEWICKSNSICY